MVLPLIAKITFHGNAGTYSIITIAMGVPALVGGLVVAHRSHVDERLLYGSGLFFGTAILAASIAPSLAIFVLFIAAVGGGQIFFMTTCNTMVQLRSDPQMRGRVMSVYLITMWGSTPIGGPLVGWISQQYGPRYGLAIGGVATVGATLVFGTMMLRARRASDSEARDHQAELVTA